MKVFITAAAMIVLWTMFFIYQTDTNKYTRELEHLKHTADECAASAALYYNDEKYGEGIKVYNQAEGNKAILYLMKNNLNLNDDLSPKNPFFSGTVSYYAYYFDDSGYMYSYKNGEYQGKTAIAFGYLFTEPSTGYKKLIAEPCVVVTINEGKANYKLSFLKISDAIRTSAYEYKEEY